MRNFCGTKNARNKRLSHFWWEKSLVVLIWRKGRAQSIHGGIVMSTPTPPAMAGGEVMAEISANVILFVNQDCRTNFNMPRCLDWIAFCIGS